MKERHLGFKGNTEGFGKRSLSEDVPGLAEYLHPGAQVLDVGCGPGSITVDVALAVAPGTAVGIDPMEDRIDMATQLASDGGVRNVTFEVGDAHALRFPDDTFDVVYSNTVLHSLVDPPKALAEQKRVSRPGGWVIASGVRDWGFSPRYPPCPALDKVHKAFVRYQDLLKSRHQAGRKVPGQRERQLAEFRYLDLHAGRKCVRWFCEAGMTELRVQFRAESLEYPGSEQMVPHLSMVPPLDAPQDPLWDVYRDIIAKGLIDQAALEEAREEMAVWYRHPHAFNMVGLIFIAGRA
jgi:ubiquinone/menaquinone biosynthesis C-methylase UbiE